MTSSTVKVEEATMSRKWLPSGWRRSAFVNLTMMSVSLLIFISFLATAVSATGELSQSWKFYSADCKSTATANTLLHLLINVLSTAILASSNFFMQVLNAPSRKEVDAAHARGSWVDIGIPSLRNAFSLSRFKLLAWLSLLLSSIPIHMLLNSAVFQIGRRDGDFHVIIATRSFVEGGSYFLPGASLATKDLIDYGRYNASNPKTEQSGYHNHVGNYSLRLSYQALSQNNIPQASIISEAAAQASGWDTLEPSECRSLYAKEFCSGLRKYRNVVMITEGPGWKRSDLWNLSATADELWQPFVPRDEVNTLWWEAQCQMEGLISSTTKPVCSSICDVLTRDRLGPKELKPGDPWLLQMKSWYRTSSYGNYGNTTLYSAPDNITEFGKKFTASEMPISYCLAEPREDACAVALSKPLLLGVILSILVKVVTCVVVTQVLGTEESLVTPGDAVASFISNQEGQGLATVSGLLTQDLVRQRAKGKKKDAVYQPIEPQIWAPERRRRSMAIPKKVWISTYSILVLSIIGTFAGFTRSQIVGSGSLQFTKSDQSETDNVLPAIGGGLAFISSVLVVNVPQLYFSFWYLLYNGLVTRLELSREWDMFSLEYRPLRVSHPKGHQSSTYRLQLPFKLSIPLMLCSILAHWLLSNALFIMVSQGNYYHIGAGYYMDDSVSLPKDAAVGIGTSSMPLLVLALLASVMMILPIVLSRMELPGYMPIVGSNSLAISAACRISPLAKVPRDCDDWSDERGNELDELVTPSNEGSKEGLANVEDMILHPLKWGEVEMPKDWYREAGGDNLTSDQIGHLSFGTVLDDPRPPTEGRLYI